MANERNPLFLGAEYQAGCRMVDSRSSIGQQRTASGRLISHHGIGQWWTQVVVVKDVSETLSFRRMFLADQEMRQLGDPQPIPVAQESTISDQVPVVASTLLETTVKADPGDHSVTIRNTSSSPIPLFVRWFIKFTNANHHKVYAIRKDTTESMLNLGATKTINIYPDLVSGLAVGTGVELYPSLRSAYGEIISIQQLVIERKPMEIVTLNFVEDF